jgi:pimeloyl-ACP methyl ester carboxylesterase
MEVPVVLVHGFWHGSWCWSLVTEQLSSRGIRSVAVDLDGHGLKGRAPHTRWSRPMDAAAFATEPSPVADVTASSAAATLVEQLGRIGSGRPCLVVAHSMGGVVATAAAELAPELMTALVYVAAFAPVAGLPAAAYNAAPENAGELVNRLLVADPMAVGAARIDTGDANRHALIRETFYNDVDADTAAAATALLSTDGLVGIPGEALAVTAPRYGAVPHAYVLCTRDNTIPVAMQRRFVKEIDAVSAQPTNVAELDSSHSPFLSQPSALAEVITSVGLNNRDDPRAQLLGIAHGVEPGDEAVVDARPPRQC